MKNILYSSLLLVVVTLMGFTFFTTKKRVVFLGDSITQAGVERGGYITLLNDALATYGKASDYELIGAGIGGNKVPDLQNRLEKDVLAKKPDLVFIFIGVNDVWHFTHPNTNGKGTPKDQYRNGLNNIIAQIKKTGAKVVLCTPAVIGEKYDMSNEQDGMLDEYSQISRQVAETNHLPLCDLRKAFMDYLKINNPKNAEKEILTSDGVHLNAAGNAFVALQIMPFLLSN